MSDSRYAPGVYVKGDDERVAGTAADAVALSFEGYTRKADAEADATPSTAPPVPVTPDAPVRDEVPKPRAPKPDTSDKPAEKKD